MAEVMTAQQWMQLGYPRFLASRLEDANREAVQEGNPQLQLTPDRAALLSTEDLMDFALTWEGIIGYSHDIVEAVQTLTKMKGED